MAQAGVPWGWSFGLERLDLSANWSLRSAAPWIIRARSREAEPQIYIGHLEEMAGRWLSGLWRAHSVKR
jgi:hypothetical protein